MPHTKPTALIGWKSNFFFHLCKRARFLLKLLQPANTQDPPNTEFRPDIIISNDITF